MAHRVTLLVLALTALFTLQFADCVSPVSADQETMQCCGTMPCNPTNQSHDCCKSMVSSNASSMLPAQHIALHLPVTEVLDHFAMPDVALLADVFQPQFEASEHAPPELYTLHSSLLI
jgi:hypothetical protein